MDEYELIDYSELPVGEEDITGMRKWLQPTDYNAESSEYRRHLSARSPETGLWLLKTAQFQEWCESPRSSSIWVKGVPGAGKSVVAASIIDHLMQTTSTPVLYFFFRQIVFANHTAASLIRDWLEQLVPYSKYLQGRLAGCINKTLEEFSTPQLWNILLSALRSTDKVFCVVDALDEMDASEDILLQRLNDLASDQNHCIKILMTSRPKQYLQSKLRHSSIVHISLEQNFVDVDINLFVLDRLKQAGFGTSSVYQLQESISKRSKGLFLYARLLVDQLAPAFHKGDLATVEKSIDAIPTGLEAMYTTMLESQRILLGLSVDLQEFLLALVTHAARPLMLGELSAALRVHLRGQKDAMSYKDIARHACSPLLEILEDETVQVIHHSFTEFLFDETRGQHSASPNRGCFPILSNHHSIHRNLVLLCLQYLHADGVRLDSFNEKSARHDMPHSPYYRPFQPDRGMSTPFDNHECVEIQPDFIFSLARLELPFIDYAMTYFAYHVHQCDAFDEMFFTALDGFITNLNHQFRVWLTLNWGASLHQWPQTLVKGAPIASPLHVAAYIGSVAYCKRLLESGAPVSGRDSDLRTPLHWAARKGHLAVISLLLMRGADPKARDRRGLAAIHEAAKSNHTQALRVFIDVGVSPDTTKDAEDHAHYFAGGERSTRGKTPIDYAFRRGHTESLVVMLPHASSSTREKILCASARDGLYDNVKLLLADYNVPADAKFRGDTALMYAIRKRDMNMTRLLLTQGADPYARCFTERSSWSRMRLRNQALPDRPVEPSTPLYCALLPAHTEEFEFSMRLIDRVIAGGGNLEGEGSCGNSLFESCFSEGNSQRSDIDPQMLHYLLVKGIKARISPSNLPVNTEHNAVVLERCLRRIDQATVPIIEQLLKRGFSINTRLSNRYSVIGWILKPPYSQDFTSAEISTRTQLIDYLISVEASCDPVDLVSAVKEGFDYETLVRMKACCAMITDDYVFTAAAQAPNPEMMCSLLDALVPGRDVSPVLFHIQASDSAIAVEYIKALQARGADVEYRNEDGNTALLHHLREWERAYAFLICGADGKAVNAKGQNAIHILLAHGHFSPYRVQLLVERGADPSKRDFGRNSLLHSAAQGFTIYNQPTITALRLIKEWHVDLNAQNARGRTFLHEFMLSEKAAPDSMYMQNMIDTLRNSRSDLNVNMPDHSGYTTFHLAVEKSEQLVLEFLSMGANLQLAINDGKNAVHLACLAGRADTVQLLLQLTDGSLGKGKDNEGKTPLHYACIKGDIACVYSLLQYSADVNGVDMLRSTPLHYCCDSQQGLLQEQSDAHQHTNAGGAHSGVPARRMMGPDDVNSSRFSIKSQGKTVLQRRTIVSMLVAAGADPNITDAKRLTPLDRAVDSCLWDIATMLSKITSDGEKLPEGTIPAVEFSRAVLHLECLPKAPKDKFAHLSKPSHIWRSPEAYLSLLTPYDVKYLADHGADIIGFHFDTPRSSLIDGLVAEGLVDHLAPLCHILRLIDDAETRDESCQKLGIKSDPKTCPRDLLLNIACSQHSSRMWMIHFLVETVQVNLNAVCEDHEQTRPRRRFGSNNEGLGALHLLAKEGLSWQVDAMKYLISKGADVHIRTKYGKTPLHIVSQQWRHMKDQRGQTIMNRSPGLYTKEMISILLDAGADLDAVDEAGQTCLNDALGSKENLQYLLGRGGNLNAGRINPLATAIDRRDTTLIRVLLEHGADAHSPFVSHHSQYGNGTPSDCPRYPLLHASLIHSLNSDYMAKEVEVVKLLINHGCKLDVALTGGKPLVHLVFEQAAWEIVQVYLDDSRLDTHLRDNNGNTLLMSACSSSFRPRRWSSNASGMKPPALHLLETGADVYAINSDGKTALHLLLANTWMTAAAMSLILDSPSLAEVVTIADKNGVQPIHVALEHLRVGGAKKLLSLGADLLLPDPRSGDTALHHLSKSIGGDRGEIYSSGMQFGDKLPTTDEVMPLWIRYLVLGGDINARNNAGYPPLFTYLATGSRNISMKSSCFHAVAFDNLFRTADLQVRNDEGETALHIVASRVHDEVGRVPGGTQSYNALLFQFLLDKGLDPLIEDNLGRTSLDVASAYGRTDILDLFKQNKAKTAQDI